MRNNRAIGRTIQFVGVLAFGIALHSVGTAADPDAHWPSWRGPRHTGSAQVEKAPVQWGPDKNIRWKAVLPGRGHGTPVIWGNQIYLTSAIPFGEKLPPRFSGRPGAHDNLPVEQKQRFVVICVSRDKGEILWQRTCREALPLEGAHHSASLASASPVTDGKHVYAHFGSFGIHCLDAKGNIVWQRDLGKMHTKHGHGEGSGPVLHGGLLFINWDHEGQSKLYALDALTGKTRWSRERDEVTSWSTPLIVQLPDGSHQLVVCGTERVRGYRPSDGEVLWECGGLSANIVATPVSDDGIVYVGSSYEIRAMMAIRLEKAKGDITGSDHVLWTRSRGTPYVPSPLLLGDALYFLTHYQNVMTRIDGPSGEPAPGAFRLGGLRNIYASPVAAAGNVYVTDTEGVTVVLTGQSQPELVSVNEIGESVNASLSFAEDALFIRGDKHLFCIAEKK